MSAWKKLFAAEGKPSKTSNADNPWSAAEIQTRPSSLHEGFEDGRRPRRGAGWWTWAKRIAVGMLLLAGFIQLVVKPVRNVLASDKPTRQDSAQVSLQAAEATAVGFATDYLSSEGAAGEPQRAAALEHWLYPGAFSEASDVGKWTGDAVLIADAATVQQVERVGDDGVVAAVQVRVRTFVPGTTGSAPSAEPAAPQQSGSAAFIPRVPAGYAAGPAYWLRLVVPLMQSGSRVLVTAPGPVFSGDAPTPVPVTIESDAVENERLAGPAKKIFTAYASGDLQYVAAPGAQLLGLDGALTTSAVSNVRVAAAGEKTSRNLAADVEWTLAGTSATLTQTYGMRLSDIDSPAPQLEHIGVLEPTRPEKK